MAGTAITVLGATGYTGRLIVHELRRRGITVVAAGRNPDKLQALVAATNCEPLVVDVHEPAAIERLAQRSRVIINTVGPFVDYGEPVVRAAIAHGVHYLDTTGEQPFVKAMLVHDEWARRQRVAVVCAQAFEVAVADCAAAVAAADFRDIASVHVTYATRMHASQGTQRTVLRMLSSAGYAYRGGEWIEEPAAAATRVIELPPLGQVTTVSIPSAEVITIPRHLTVREVRTFMALPRLAARLVPAATPMVRALLRTPLRHLAARVIGQGTDGPDEQTRAGDAFHLAIDVCGVRAGAATRRRLLLHGHDPYGLTAVVAAYGAQQMCADDYACTGVLAPAAAFAPQHLLTHLQAHGLTFEDRTAVDTAPAL